MQEISTAGLTNRDLEIDAMFNSDLIRQFIKQSSPALMDTYHSLSHLYLRLLNSTLTLPHFQEQLKAIFNELRYTRRQSPAYLCGRELSQGYYECYDCRKSDLSCFCSACFDYKLHEGHMFAFIDTDTGFCDCGDQALLKVEGMCQVHRKHQKEVIPQVQMVRYTNQLSFLISLGIVTFQRLQKGLVDTKKISLLQQVTSLVIKLIQNSDYYQAIIEEVLLQQINPHLSANRQVILQVLLKTVWVDQVEINIACIFTHLFKSKRIGARAISLLLKMISTEGFSKYMHKAIRIKPYFRQALCRRQIVQLIISPDTAENLVIREQLTFFPCSNFILNLYDVVEEISPDLYAQIIILLISQEQVCKIDNFTNCCQSNRQQMFIINTKVYKIVWNIFKIVNSQKPMERDIYLRMIILGSFWEIINKQLAVYFLNRLFTISVLTFCNFDLNNLLQMPIEQFQVLFSFNNTDKSQTLYRLFILLSKISCLEIDESISSDNINHYDIALDYLNLYIFAILFQRLKSTCCNDDRSLMEEFLQRAQERKQIKSKLQTDAKAAAPLLKFVTNFVKNYIFISESEVPSLIVASFIDEKAVEGKISWLFSDLATIFQGCTKLQFKQEATKWIKCDKSIKEFIAKQSSSWGKHTSDPSIHFHLSFNSYFCFFQNRQQRKLRFKAKVNSLQATTHSSLLISDRVANHLAQYYKLIIHSFEDNDPDQQIRQLLNGFLEMFMNIYLSERHPLAHEIIQDLLKRQSLRILLNDRNKEIFKIYEEVCHESAEKQKQSNAKKTQLIKKKQKIDKLKAKQRQALQDANTKYELSPEKESEAVCIICRLGRQKEESLHYLCRVMESSIAIQSILGLKTSFLLFTTCGHLIHESCLLQNFEGSMNFKQSYCCFLCKKKSNLRLPFITSEIDQQSVSQLFAYIMTIRSLQTETQKQALKDLQDEMNQKVPGQYRKQQKEVSLAQSIYNSVLYQIYLYYLSHSQMFQSYMLPIMSHLIQILRHSAHKETISSFMVPEGLPHDLTVELAVENLNRMIASKEQLIGITQENSGFEQQSVSAQAKDINKLFERLMGRQVPLRRIRQLERFNLFKPPMDLSDLKRMVKPCPSCSCLYDKQFICFLCNERACFSCLKYWRVHVLQAHRGSCASLMIRNGICHYEYFGKKNLKDCMYKDYLGQRYDDSKVQVKPGEYMLDTAIYEAIVIDIVMEFIEGKLQFDKSNLQRINCAAQ